MTTSQPDEMEFDVTQLVETPEDRARRLITQRGRAYLVDRRRYVAVTFHTPNLEEAVLLTSVYGGNYYVHDGKGYIWRTSKQHVLFRIANDVRSLQPPGYRIRFGILLDRYPARPENIDPKSIFEQGAQQP